VFAGSPHFIGQTVLKILAIVLIWRVVEETAFPFRESVLLRTLSVTATGW
jgi:hypothetical protein